MDKINSAKRKGGLDTSGKKLISCLQVLSENTERSYAVYEQN